MKQVEHENPDVKLTPKHPMYGLFVQDFKLDGVNVPWVWSKEEHNVIIVDTETEKNQLAKYLENGKYKSVQILV